MRVLLMLALLGLGGCTVLMVGGGGAGAYEAGKDERQRDCDEQQDTCSDEN